MIGTVLSWRREPRFGNLRGFLRDNATGQTYDFTPKDLNCKASELRPARKVEFDAVDSFHATNIRTM